MSFAIKRRRHTLSQLPKWFLERLQHLKLNTKQPLASFTHGRSFIQFLGLDLQGKALSWETNGPYACDSSKSQPNTNMFCDKFSETKVTNIYLYFFRVPHKVGVGRTETRPSAVLVVCPTKCCNL